MYPQSIFLYHTPYCLHQVLDTFLSSLFSFFNKNLKIFTSIFDNYFRSICFSIFFLYIWYNKHLRFGCVQQSPPSKLHSSRSNLWPLKELCYHFFFLKELYLNNTFDFDINATKVCLSKKSLLFCYKTVWLRFSERSTLVGVPSLHCCNYLSWWWVEFKFELTWDCLQFSFW